MNTRSATRVAGVMGVSANHSHCCATESKINAFPNPSGQAYTQESIDKFLKDAGGKLD